MGVQWIAVRRADRPPSHGVFATLADLLRFLLLFDPSGPGPIHSAAGLRTMTTDQTNVFRSAAPVLSPEYPVSKWGVGFMIQGENGEVGLASPESYGHLGGTGCVGWIDPVYRVTVAFVSNSDASRLGRMARTPGRSGQRGHCCGNRSAITAPAPARKTRTIPMCTASTKGHR